MVISDYVLVCILIQHIFDKILSKENTQTRHGKANPIVLCIKNLRLL